MQFISSDTNIWIDFEDIGFLKLPFLLDIVFLMVEEIYNDEILKPEDLRERLLSLGLQITKLSEDEVALTDKYYSTYTKLSRYDCMTLAIAKSRNIILLTGDKRLRKAAQSEGVNYKGTLWILDQLLKEKRISQEEFRNCISLLLKNEKNKVRLPVKELKKRLKEDYTVK